MDHLTHLIQSDTGFGNLGSSISESTRFVGADQLTENIRSTAIEVEWHGVESKNLRPQVHYQSPERSVGFTHVYNNKMVLYFAH